MSVNGSSNSRRKFIKGVGAGTALSSLSVQSVWGACNATGISGGSQALDLVCRVPNLKGGYSHGSWDKFIVTETVNSDNSKTCSVHNNADNKMKNIFGLSNLSSEELLEKTCQIQEFYKAVTITVGAPGLIEVKSFTIYDAFTQSLGGDTRSLAALWLNAYFDLLTLNDSNFTDPDDIVSDFYASLTVSHNNQVDGVYQAPDMGSEIDDTYSYSGNASFDKIFDFFEFPEDLSCTSCQD